MEKVIVFNIKSALGSFQKPQSNNNPSTFSIIPKSAVVGIISAIIGLERNFMVENNMYKELTEKLRYSVKLCSPFHIKYWSEYGYNHRNLASKRPNYNPTKFERLVDVNYNVYILYNTDDTDLNALIGNFIDYIKKNVHVFHPFMGMANCPIKTTYIGEYDAQPHNGEFKTSTFCTSLVMSDDQPFEDIRTDNLPTRCNSYLSFDNESYKTIYFNDKCGTLQAKGNYHQVGDESVEFI